MIYFAKWKSIEIAFISRVTIILHWPISLFGLLFRLKDSISLSNEIFVSEKVQREKYYIINNLH